MRRTTVAAALTLLCALALLPQAAEASCLAGTVACVCGPVVPDLVADGTVVSVDGNTGLLDIEAVYPQDAEAPASPVEFERSGFEAVGDRLLLHFKDGALTHRQTIDADGMVHCGAHDVTMTAATAAELPFQSDCAARLPDYGYHEIPCDDVGGCASAGGASGTAVLLILVAGLLVGARRARGA